MPPRRATVSAIRRPATAVMFDTTRGMVVPIPSGVVRSTLNARRHVGQARHHEDVVVRQVVAGIGVEQFHRESRSIAEYRASAVALPFWPEQATA